MHENSKLEEFGTTISKRNPMTEESIKDECSDPTQTLTIELPCQIVKRIERYAKKNKTDVTGVLIETLDSFLKKPK